MTMTPATWVLDGVTFYGDDVGTGYLIVSEMEGVNDAPAVRTEEVPPPLGDGDFPQKVTRAPRLITARGWCRAANEAGLLTLRNAFTGILDDGAQGTFTINEFGVVRTATVEIYGQPKFSIVGETLSANWSLMLRAVDPKLYDAGTGPGHW